MFYLKVHMFGLTLHSKPLKIFEMLCCRFGNSWKNPIIVQKIGIVMQWIYFTMRISFHKWFYVFRFISDWVLRSLWALCSSHRFIIIFWKLEIIWKQNRIKSITWDALEPFELPFFTFFDLWISLCFVELDVVSFFFGWAPYSSAFLYIFHKVLV